MTYSNDNMVLLYKEKTNYLLYYIQIILDLKQYSSIFIFTGIDDK